MRSNHFAGLILGLAILISSWNIPDNKWLVKEYEHYTLMYTSADESNIDDYNKLLVSGISSAASFFKSSFTKKFTIIIHPGRNSLDSTWQTEWKMPEFKSECWMVASGMATRLDMISPVLWEKEACEHNYSDKKSTQQLITHEMVHVYHGQANKSPDFSNVEGIDWFVEGLATFVSGQCNSNRIATIKEAINGGQVPKGLDNFWTGKLKYGLSGSMVMFIENKFGRTKLKELLPLTKKSEILSSLQTTEPELLNEWEKYIRNL